jgi:dTDP-4-amino-4,6-dideoxygalactose transaminase
VTWRYQLPAYSPITARGLGQGFQGLVGDRSFLESVDRWLTNRLNAREVLLTDSGTTALSLAFKAVGSPVALPAYGCFDLATAADGAGQPVVLYDMDPATLGPSPESLNAALGAGASAVVVVHFYGIPADLGSGSVPVPVIEDAAQAWGGSLGNVPLGAQGSLAVLSFGRGKGLTGGGGGALVANDDRGVELLHRVAALARPGGSGAGSWARSVAQWLLARPAFYRIPASLPFLGLGETPYHPPHPPTAMSRASAGIMLRASSAYEEEVGRRQVHARRLIQAARELDRFQVIAEPRDASSGYLRLPLLVSDSVRAAALQPSARRLGIMPGYPVPLNRLGGFEKRVANPAQSMPGAELLARRLITLPVHGMLTEPDLRALEQWMRARRG